MYPFLNNPFGIPCFPPVGPFPAVARRRSIPTIDTRGIPELCTTGIAEGDTVDYGINPCLWRQLPCQTLVLWKVRHPVTTAGAASPVTVVTPTGSGASTVTPSGSTAGTSRVPVVDNKGTQVTGSDVTNTDGPYTEHLVYIDKAAGIFRMLGVTATGAPAPTAAQAEAAAKTK